MRVRAIIAIYIVYLSLTCAHAEKNSDVNLSWVNASVFVFNHPEIKQTKQLNALKDSLPVLIYLHGCAGINRDALNWASYISSLGFVVILPNSMARNGRVANCDPKLKKGNGAFPLARAYRQQEITYALNQVIDSPWAQRKNIFLMGHSEGGTAVAQSPHAEFAGEIISGETCTDRKNPAYDGIFAPIEMPVLAIASIDDEWHENKPAVKGRCADKAQGRSFFTQVDLPGSTHPTYGSPIAREAVRDFLTQHRTLPGLHN